MLDLVFSVCRLTIPLPPLPLPTTTASSTTTIAAISASKGAKSAYYLRSSLLGISNLKI